MNKKRLLIFHPTIAPYRIDFFNSLCEHFDARVYLTVCDDGFNYSKIFNHLSFKPTILNNHIKIGAKKICTDIWSIIDGYSPDIVVVGEFGVETISVFLHRKIRKCNYKIVSICDDNYDMLTGGKDFGMMHRLGRFFLASRIDEIILPDTLAKDWFQQHYGRGIFMPIIRDDTSMRNIYEKTLANSQEIIKQIHSNDKNVFLFVGRFVSLKNVDTLIKSFSKLNRKENLLVLVGSGDEDKNLRSLVEQLGCENVIFTGRLEDEALYAWYNVADYFVLPSWLEAFGAVTNEALLAGCYSIVSEKAGSRCLIENGRNGYTFSPMNVDELTEKMVLVSQRFKKTRPVCRVKPNLMVWNYREMMEKLIARLYAL